ncbi:MAG: ECF transporter S component [Bacteroidales bacterium]|jgi:hypothetical protein|nr:ECF transporter S component [Bacteroidales bacterium]
MIKSTNITIKELNFSYLKNFLLLGLFITGNIILPAICHYIPNGGIMLLPMFFFTLIAAYKYGIKAGLITAILSPVINFMIFGMPAIEFLPAILIKSSSLALIAWFVAKKTHKLSILLLAFVVVSSQTFAFLLDGFIFLPNFNLAFTNLLISIPGMLIQIFAGYFIIKKLCK